MTPVHSGDLGNHIFSFMNLLSTFTCKNLEKSFFDPFLDKYEKQLQNGAKTWTMLDTSGGKTVNNFEKNKGFPEKIKF